MLARGLAKRCPLCGGGRLFRRWFTMRERCPRCGHRFDRDEGFFLGAYVVNLAVVEGLLLVGVFVVFIAVSARDPDVPGAPFIAAGAGLGVLGPLVFYPFSKTIWAAIDLILRPAGVREPTDRA